MTLVVLVAAACVAAQQGAVIGKVTARAASTVEVTLEPSVRTPPAAQTELVFTRSISGYEARAGRGQVVSSRDRIVTVRITSGRPDLASVARLTAPPTPPPNSPTPPTLEVPRPEERPPAVDGARSFPGFGRLTLPAGARVDASAMPVIAWGAGPDSVSLRLQRVKVDDPEARALVAVRRRVGIIRAPGSFDLRWEVRRLEQQVTGAARCTATSLVGRHTRRSPRLVVVAACEGRTPDEAIRLEFETTMGEGTAAADAAILSVIRSFAPTS